MGEDVSKTQTIRLLDVFVLGPFMVWSGLQKRQRQPYALILVVAGLLTIAYNFKNWHAQELRSPVTRKAHEVRPQ